MILLGRIARVRCFDSDLHNHPRSLRWDYAFLTFDLVPHVFALNYARCTVNRETERQRDRETERDRERERKSERVCVLLGYRSVVP